MALIVASVPLEQKRSFSIEGKNVFTFSAISVSIAVGAPNDKPFSIEARTASSTLGLA